MTWQEVALLAIALILAVVLGRQTSHEGWIRRVERESRDRDRLIDKRLDDLIAALPGILETHMRPILEEAEAKFRRATFEEFGRALEHQAEKRASADARQAKELLQMTSEAAEARKRNKGE